MRPEQRQRYRTGQVKRRLPFSERVELVARYLQRERATHLAKSYGVTRMTVYRLTRHLAVCLAFFLLIPMVGCDHPLPRVRALPAPAVESPALQLPIPMRQRNWTTKEGGSCVYASLTTQARWLNKLELADWLSNPSINGGGEYSSRLRRKLDSIDVPYAYTEQGKPEFLDWCSRTRRGCILWWKPSHCCTFAGWTVLDGRVYAAIIDNNQPGRYELTERSVFLKAWASYGGFGLALLYDPASPRPWLSYQVID